ncbi:MAG: carboxypeptidase-like regulatory domain-containing protein [Blastocatellia bacterium]
MNENELYRVEASAPGYVSSVEEGGWHRSGSNVVVPLSKGGVIVGLVSDSAGEPVVQATVRAMRVRISAGGRRIATGAEAVGLTDDRGFYRIYGLKAGRYIVSAGPTSRVDARADDAYEGELPSYYPSASRTMAEVLQVSLGAELGGIDIRFRGAQGYQIEGLVRIPAPLAARLSRLRVSLVDVSSGDVEAETAGRRIGEDLWFEFSGVAEGEFEVTAEALNRSAQPEARARVKVTIAGGSETGVRLVLEPLAQVDGRLVVAKEPTSACGKEQPARYARTLVRLVRLDDAGSDTYGPNSRRTRSEIVGSASGSFRFAAVEAGRYSLVVDGDERLYVKSIGAARPNARGREILPGQIVVESGGGRDEVEVTFGFGAARLEGRVSGAVSGVLTSKLSSVILVPQSEGEFDTWYRYAIVPAGSEGGFVVKGVAPGKYMLLALETETMREAGIDPNYAKWDRRQLVAIRRLARRGGVSVALGACERKVDHVITVFHDGDRVR